MSNFYITGDIHGHYDIEKIWNWAKNTDFNEKTYLIITGDFGLIFYGKYAKKYQDLELPNLKKLNSMPFTTLFVDGNHENFDRLNDKNEFKRELWNGGEISRIMPNIIHLRRGQIFEIDGVKFFTLGGALSLDKNLRKPHVSWWEEELISNKEIMVSYDNLKKNNLKVDYIITHAGPRSFAKNLFESFGSPFYAHDNTEIHLESLILGTGIEFKHWYCGHYHIDKTIDNVTTLYDSIIRVGESL